MYGYYWCDFFPLEEEDNGKLLLWENDIYEEFLMDYYFFLSSIGAVAPGYIDFFVEDN